MAEVKEIEYSSRITIKDLGCKPGDVSKLPDAQNELPMARMYGIVTRVGFQEDSRQAGRQYTYFVGNFEGVNLQDGTVMTSSKMYLPEGVSQALEQIVAQAKAKDKRSPGVQFAFEIIAVKNPNNKGGYSYKTITLHKPEEADPLAALRTTVAAVPGHGGKDQKHANPQAAKKSA